MTRLPPISTLFPSTTLFRSRRPPFHSIRSRLVAAADQQPVVVDGAIVGGAVAVASLYRNAQLAGVPAVLTRSETTRAAFTKVVLSNATASLIQPVACVG